MLKIEGSITRSFVFPAAIQTALSFYENLEQLASFLPNIDLVTVHQPGQYRMVYSATEMGAYHIRIFCDVATQVARNAGIIRIIPINDYERVKARASFNASAGQGFYASESQFTEIAGQTHIEYTLELIANLPRPKGLRFMPAAMVTGLAGNITNWRLQEIADGFIENSLAAFPGWLARQQQTHF